MTLNSEKQTLKKIKTVLRLLEDTLNNEGDFEVRINSLKSEKVHITNEREKFLEVGIESSIIGLKDLIQKVEDKKERKEQLKVYTTVPISKKSKKPH